GDRPVAAADLPPGGGLTRSCAEDTVAGVAEAGEDVAAVVQFAVDGCAVDGNFGVLVVDAADTFGGGDEADDAEVADAGLLEEGDGAGGAAAGGEHGVDQQHLGGGDVGGQLAVVAD